MWRAFVVIAWLALAGCGRLDFTALGDGGARDGTALRDVRGSGDGPTAHDASGLPLVQAVTASVTMGVFNIGSANGLAPVTAGDMVLVMCGEPNNTGTCLPMSTPTATWQQIDPGTTLSVYVTCGAPAITTLELFNGSGPAAAIVTEWSGIAASGCYDVGTYGVACGSGSDWMVNVGSSSQENKELLVALGMSGKDPAWSVVAPYTLASTNEGPADSVAVFVAAELADPAPVLPSVSGTVGTRSGACFDDLFAFEAVQ